MDQIIQGFEGHDREKKYPWVEVLEAREKDMIWHVLNREF